MTQISSQGLGALVMDDNQNKGKFLHEPGDHVESLHCLCDFTREIGKPDIPLEEALERAAELVSSSLRFPENTCARITLGETEYKTRGFQETCRTISADIYVDGKKDGAIDAYLLEEMPEADEEPFTHEDHDLIEALSRQLGTIIEYRQAMEKLLAVNRKLDRNAHSVSHDLKGPLTAINLAVTLLNGKFSQQPETDVSFACYELLEIVGLNVKKAIRMADDLQPNHSSK